MEPQPAMQATRGQDGRRPAFRQGNPGGKSPTRRGLGSGPIVQPDTQSVSGAARAAQQQCQAEACQREHAGFGHDRQDGIFEPDAARSCGSELDLDLSRAGGSHGGKRVMVG